MAAPCPIVLVHGAFHGAWCWAPLQAELDRLGIPSYAIDLPGHGASTAPLENLHGDADAVAALLERLARDGDGDVVLVGHSYGGAVIGQAGLAGRVRRLVFLAALVLEEGECASEVVMRQPAEDSGVGRVMRRDRDGVLVPLPEAAGDVFYNTCAPALTAAASARLCPQRAASLKQPATLAAWRNRPSTYIRCGQDRASSPALQDAMAARCGADVLRIDTDHSPFFSAPAELAALLAPLTA
jgi:pimeloyl-ACP methyl ester carboxylesterase